MGSRGWLGVGAQGREESSVLPRLRVSAIRWCDCHSQGGKGAGRTRWELSVCLEYKGFRRANHVTRQSLWLDVKGLELR